MGGTYDAASVGVVMAVAGKTIAGGVRVGAPVDANKDAAASLARRRAAFRSRRRRAAMRAWLGWFGVLVACLWLTLLVLTAGAR